MSAQDDTHGALSDLLRELREGGPLVEDVQAQCGELMVRRTQDAFRLQGRSEPWPPRGGPSGINRIGVLRDLEEGRNPPARRFDPRPAGMDTGTLRNSPAWEPVPGGIRFGSSVAHAEDFQEGKEVTIPITGTLRKRLAAWLKKLPEGIKEAARAAFGPLFTLGVLKVKVPGRVYVEITDQDRDDCQKILQDSIQERLKKGRA